MTSAASFSSADEARREKVKSLLLTYFITGPATRPGVSLQQTVADAIAGGATMVQLRDTGEGNGKGKNAREIIRVAQSLLEVTRPAGIPLIIDDRVDICLAAGADGVHVGQASARARGGGGPKPPERT